MNAAHYRAHLLSGEAFPASGALLLPQFESSGAWTGVFAHEYFHFLQFTGTGFGRMISFMIAFLGDSMGAALRDSPDFLRQAHSWYFPVRDWCAAEPDDALRATLLRHFAHLINEGDTISLLLGWLPHYVRDNCWRGRWNLTTTQPVGDILPHMKVQGSAEYFGGFHVMESAAAIQGLRMEGPDIAIENGRLGFALDEQRREELGDWPVQYRMGAQYVAQHSGLPRAMLESVTVLAADLALACHFEWLADGGPDSVRWEDWHPGWRFVKAVAAIESVLSGGHQWPSSEDGLVRFHADIGALCGWPDEPSDLFPLVIFQDAPSKADRIRLALSREAHSLRRQRLSLWSIGSREQILDAAFKWFKPPLLLEYGKDQVHFTRPDLSGDSTAWGELWQSMERADLAWQLLRPGGIGPPARAIECFPWRKQGSGSSCASSNGTYRWFPAPPGANLPESCPMLHALKGMCGNRHERLQPLRVPNSLRQGPRSTSPPA